MEVTETPTVNDGQTKDIATPTEIAAAGKAATPAPNTTPPETKTAATKDPATQTGGEVPPPFSPNLKFKVLDKEHEFAPYLKDVIKDEKTEKEIRELYEKAYGLDHVKPKYTKTREELESLKSEYNGLVDDIVHMRELYKAGDMDGFFNKLQVPFEDILQYVADKIEYSKLPPEQKNEIDARKRLAAQTMELQKSSKQKEQQYHQQLVQAKGHMLDLTLSKSDVANFSKRYEEKTGKSFRDAVIEYGNAVYHTRKDAQGNKVDLTPEQAVNELMEHYGKLLGPDTPQQQAPQTQKNEPPTIPNVSGKQNSPAGGSQPSSIKELREIYNKMRAG